MGMKEHIPRREDDSLDILEFKRKIRAFKEEERAHKKTAHFMKTSFSPELNEENLTGEDMAIWEKLQAKTLSLPEFEAYRTRVRKEGSIDRQIFTAFIANKMVDVMYGDGTNA